MTRRRKKTRRTVERYSKFLERVPEAKPWLDIGLIPRAARALCGAGIFSLEQLRAFSREDFLAIRGAGEIALSKCEEALGKPLPSARQYWKEQGVTGQAAGALMRLGIKSVEEIKVMERGRLLSLFGIGPLLIHHIEEALGLHFPTPGQSPA